jgi:hypothetical protein
VEVRHNLLGGNSAIVNAGEVFRVYRNEPIAERMDKGNFARQALRIVVNVIAVVGRSSGPGKITLPAAAAVAMVQWATPAGHRHHSSPSSSSGPAPLDSDS